MLPTIPEIPLHPRAACTLLRSLSPSHLRQAQQLHAHTTISGDSLRHPLLVNHLISFYSRSGYPFLSSLVFSSALTKTHISYTSLASAFASNGLPHLSLSLFRTIHSLRLPLDDRALPIFAKACASAADARLGRCVHSLACRTGFSSNVFVGSSLVDMYAKSGHLFDARRLFDEMPVRNVVSWGGLIHGYSLSGETEMGLRLFREAVRDRGVDVRGRYVA
ncbi:putative pentatricopeptide repeat-containing protein [Acorus calamus]|uniref:Pentatricopeptide repeat-containing protein n=1 Tax=Acorus calamus TaxID=4465 RepID=A0AAV9C1K9_ACOCL|nr:putative pentatricopeptide repeat-containing protein [Acorus calamus]